MICNFIYAISCNVWVDIYCGWMNHLSCLSPVLWRSVSIALLFVHWYSAVYVRVSVSSIIQLLATDGSSIANRLRFVNGRHPPPPIPCYRPTTPSPATDVLFINPCNYILTIYGPCLRLNGDDALK